MARRIRFEATDELGNEFSQETTGEILEGIDFGFIDFVGQQLNLFLKQMTFSRQNDYILMEDVSEDELEALECFLEDYRERKKETSDEL